MKRNMKRIMVSVFTLALFLVLPFAPKLMVSAEGSYYMEFTTTPVSYDLATGEATVTYTMKDQYEGKIAYCPYSWEEGTMTDEMFLSRAIFTDAREFTVTGKEGDSFYIRQVDDNHNLLGGYNTAQITLCLLLPAKDTFGEFLNGELVEDYGADIALVDGKVNIDQSMENGTVHWIIYCNGEFQLASSSGLFIDENGLLNMRRAYTMEGLYELRYRVVSDTQYSPIRSITFDYKKPEVALGGVSDFSWDSNVRGRIKYRVQDPEYSTLTWTFEKIKDGNTSTVWCSTLPTDLGDGWFYADYDYIISEDLDALYRISATVWSTNPELYANGPTVYAGLYDPKSNGMIADTLSQALDGMVDTSEGVTAEVLDAALTEATEEQKQQIVEASKEALTQVETEELKSMMHSQAETAELVKVLEEASDVVVNTQVDATVQNKIDSSSISVVGAGLNATEGNKEVTLSIKESDMSYDTSSYSNGVAVEISLDGVDNASTELAIPVRITMTAPEGMDMDKLVILHYDENNNLSETIQDETLHKNHKTREISFTVSHFSPFIFVEKGVAEDPVVPPTDTEPSTPINPAPSTPVTSNTGSYEDVMRELQDRIESAGAGNVVTVTKSENIDTITIPIMNALVTNKVSLSMEYTYEGNDYKIFIPYDKAYTEGDIEYFGPLFLNGWYGKYSATDAGSGQVQISGDVYIVQKGDTLNKIAKSSGMTLNELLALNPQIKNPNFIVTGQKLNLK